jgi:AcrR family transcriptional regulator
VAQSRSYVSPKRAAQAAATRQAILEAFAEQLADPERVTLSPSEAAHRAGVSVRTVHTYFPNRDDQIVALSEWFDRQFHPEGVQLAQGPDDLPRYFHDVHVNALQSPLSRALVTAPSPLWREIRERRRADRLDAVRRAVRSIGAPPLATADATAVLLGLSGAEVSWTMHDHGLARDRIPGAIAHTVQLVVDDLRAAAGRPRRTTTSPNPPTD